MYETLFLAKETIKLTIVNSTNSYLKELLISSSQNIEGVMVVADDQTLGRGQRGNTWESVAGENITCSFLLKPQLKVADQFILSKVVSLGIVNFLMDLGIEEVKIKWPNDIYVSDDKIAGILIENTLKGSQLENCIVGIGLNVNQVNFAKSITNATSLKVLLNEQQEVEQLLQRLLFFIEKSYLQLKALKFQEINSSYLNLLYRLNEPHQFLIDEQQIEAIIVGVAASGKLQLEIAGLIKEFDLQEVRFV